MEKIKGARLFFYNLSYAGHALLDTLILFYCAVFFIPPKEEIAKGMIQFLSDKTFFGVLTVMGIIMFFGRIVDAVADPLIASWSDRSKSHLGRRRFFLIIGGLPLAISAILVFFPPVPSITFSNAFYLAIVLGAFFFFYTMYVAPYISLIPELGHTEKERLNITTVQGIMALVGAAIVMILGPILVGVFKQSVSPTIAYQIMVIIMGVIAALLLYSAVFAVDEKRFSNARPSNVSVTESIKKTLSNKPFIIFLITNMTFWFIFNTLRSSINHLAITVMKGSEGDALLYNIAIFGFAALFFFLNWFIIKKIGKKKLMLLGLISFAIFSFMLAITGLLPVDPKIWGLVFFGLCGFPAAVFLVMPNVFISELCDLDFKKTGERREAMYFGVHGFFVKIILGLSFATLSFFYLSFGKDISNPLGVRLTLAAAGVVALIGFIVFFFYPVLNPENKK